MSLSVSDGVGQAALVEAVLDTGLVAMFPQHPGGPDLNAGVDEGVRSRSLPPPPWHSKLLLGWLHPGIRQVFPATLKLGESASLKIRGASLMELLKHGGRVELSCSSSRSLLHSVSLFFPRFPLPVCVLREK